MQREMKIGNIIFEFDLGDTHGKDYYMNSPTGSVDTAEGWLSEDLSEWVSPDITSPQAIADDIQEQLATLIEVKEDAAGEWQEV